MDSILKRTEEKSIIIVDPCDVSVTTYIHHLLKKSTSIASFIRALRRVILNMNVTEWTSVWNERHTLAETYEDDDLLKIGKDGGHNVVFIQNLETTSTNSILQTLEKIVNIRRNDKIRVHLFAAPKQISSPKFVFKYYQRPNLVSVDSSTIIQCFLKSASDGHEPQ
jgi:hypothetical protein